MIKLLRFITNYYLPCAKSALKIREKFNLQTPKTKPQVLW